MKCCGKKNSAQCLQQDTIETLQSDLKSMKEQSEEIASSLEQVK
jgi:hypothetical protein